MTTPSRKFPGRSSSRNSTNAELALLYQEKTASGERSNFNKLVGRETAEAREHGESHAGRHHGTR